MCYQKMSICLKKFDVPNIVNLPGQECRSSYIPGQLGSKFCLAPVKEHSIFGGGYA